MAEYPNSRRQKNQLITKTQKKDLLTYVAGAGENYESYLMFCAKFNIPTFTPGYWRNFVQRNRRTVQALRKEHVLAVAAEARLGRQERLLILENHVSKIENILDEQWDELTVDQVVKLVDQVRKHSEAIAKERNEWGMPDEERRPNAGAKLFERAAQKIAQLQAAQDAANTVEAEAVVEVGEDEMEMIPDAA